MNTIVHECRYTVIRCWSCDLISSALHTSREVCNSVRFSSAWIGRSKEDMSVSYGPFCSFLNRKPNASRRSQHGKYSKLRENSYGKLNMGKGKRNDGLAEMMAMQWLGNHNKGSMCVPPPRMSRTGTQLALTRTWTARKNPLISWKKRIFHYYYF